MMSIDWHALFVPHGSLLEIVVRGTVMYLVLFILLRVLVRRHVGAMGVPDLLVIVLIADAAQNAMAGEYKSITEGALLCAVIIGWSVLFDWLAYRFKPLRGILEADPLPVIKDGVMLPRNMRQELITRDELLSHLREQGIDDPADVALACMEPDGAISVIKRDGKQDAHPPKRKPVQ
ncbi:MAG TPA: YetF domain-containing protein [Candidatus Eisenbacteria bacterium]